MPLSQPALEPLLRLCLVPGIGPQRFGVLMRRYGSATRALAAPARELEALPGMGPALAGRMREATGPEADARLQRALATLHGLGAVALTPDDLAYPDAFRLLPDPPFLLFAAGDLSLMQRPGVAVVGTRTPSEYGRSAATVLSDGLARAGYSIVSGMARGIDTLAHRAALAAGAPTVGVLGSGLDQVYPPENRELFDGVRRSGLLLTELPPGEKPLAGNFPRRNRLIAALSQAVLVVEMGLKSGAQHTVGYALELGREVLAVPGPIASATSAGTNQLIKEGARVVTSVEDVLEELGGVGATRAPAAPLPARDRPEVAQPALALLSPDEQRLVDALAGEPRHVDDVGTRAGLPAPRVLALLLELELRGAVESLPGKLYRRV